MPVAKTAGAYFSGSQLVYQVICAECFCDLGTMTGDIIQSALLAKGDLICPTCRSFKCWQCGIVVLDETEREHMGDEGLCNGCTAHWLQFYDEHGLDAQRFFGWIEEDNSDSLLG